MENYEFLIYFQLLALVVVVALVLVARQARDVKKATNNLLEAAQATVDKSMDEWVKKHGFTAPEVLRLLTERPKFFDLVRLLEPEDINDTMAPVSRRANASLRPFTPAELVPLVKKILKEPSSFVEECRVLTIASKIYGFALPEHFDASDQFRTQVIAYEYLMTLQNAHRCELILSPVTKEETLCMDSRKLHHFLAMSDIVLKEVMRALELVAMPSFEAFTHRVNRENPTEVKMDISCENMKHLTTAIALAYGFKLPGTYLKQDSLIATRVAKRLAGVDRSETKEVK